MNSEQLIETAQALIVHKKGILAADESGNTIKKRFDSIGILSTETTRRDYREMLFETEEIHSYISGIILFDETIRQESSDGDLLVSKIAAQGIIPGIKVDKGAKALAGSHGETITEGLDGLRERLDEYYELGARFTKWRGVLSIGNNLPTAYCVETNAHALARFAALSQEANLVPIVEPEVLMDGDHSIDACYEATSYVLREVYDHLARQNILLEGTLLKPNMVLSGKDATHRADAGQVAKLTVQCLLETVPPQVPGIVFLSGGQSDEEATVNLSAINQVAGEEGVPWQLSFSYGRGLQAAPLKIWSGSSGNLQSAQQSFYQRCEVTSLARQGLYST